MVTSEKYCGHHSSTTNTTKVLRTSSATLKLACDRRPRRRRRPRPRRQHEKGGGEGGEGRRGKYSKHRKGSLEYSLNHLPFCCLKKGWPAFQNFFFFFLPRLGLYSTNLPFKHLGRLTEDEYVLGYNHGDGDNDDLTNSAATALVQGLPYV